VEGEVVEEEVEVAEAVEEVEARVALAVAREVEAPPSSSPRLFLDLPLLLLLESPILLLLESPILLLLESPILRLPPLDSCFSLWVPFITAR
jgi:hypothetical protein